MLASATPEITRATLDALSENAALSLPWLFEFWALPHQAPPAGPWRSWAVLGGRGAGKTRTGAEWLRAQIEGPTPYAPGKVRHAALIGETHDQAREVMVMGESGLMACCPPDRRPRWEATRRRLVWPNGAVVEAFSAHDPEALRGPQFEALWLDELAKWPRAREAWDMAQFTLRSGTDPRQVITTTPRATPVLREILADPATVVTRAPTEANRANLATSFLEAVRARYGGTRLGRQELDGELLWEAEGALWTTALLEGLRIDRAPPLDRIVVAVDPPVTGGPGADACGIVVAGAALSGGPAEWRAVVLADCSLESASPRRWAEAAVAAFHAHGADRLVAEVNQGGDLVATLLRQIDPVLPFRAVRATRGKGLRAEPVAALYEQGRIRHLRDAGGGLARLEEQMCQMTRAGFQGRGSPDRLDALVWALTDLMIDPARAWSRPRLRAL